MWGKKGYKGVVGGLRACRSGICDKSESSLGGLMGYMGGCIDVGDERVC